jgi:mRNA interferase MazF
MIDYSQYQIVIVNLDPTVGSEIKKKRPCVIVSPNEMNKHLATVVVCPITSQSKNYPTRVHFELEGDTNWVVIDQIRTIDKSRVMKAIGYLDGDAVRQVKKCIREAYVD